MRRVLYLLPLLLFAGLAVYFAIGLTKDPRTLPSVMIDKPVPAFDLPALRDGQPGLTQAELTALAAGQPLLINFWASWCAPCRVEHPLLMRLAREGVVLVGIDYKDTPTAGRAFLDQLGDPFRRTVMDRDGRIAIEFGVYGVPETYVIDRAGRIRHRHVGPITPADLEKTIRPLLQDLRK